MSEVNNNYYWKNCIEPLNFLNINKIFPTQQKDVYKLINSLSENKAVSSIIIFGSTVNPGCNPWSDVDIFVKSDNHNMSDLKLRYHNLDCSVDLFTESDVDEYLLKDILQEGVVVYERE